MNSAPNTTTDCPSNPKPITVKAKAMTTTARDALRAAQTQLDSLVTQQTMLQSRIAGFLDAANVPQPSQQMAADLRARRAALLGAVALGDASHAELEALDAELLTAEAAARSAALGQEIAAAGAARLQAEFDATAARAQPVAASMAGLLHAAAVELATEKMQDYRAAVQAMGEAHATLAGACLAADVFCDMYANPRRYPVTGELHRLKFEAPTPMLPTVDRAEWAFDYTKQASDAKAAAMLALGTNPLQAPLGAYFG